MPGDDDWNCEGGADLLQVPKYMGRRSQDRAGPRGASSDPECRELAEQLLREVRKIPT
jgi:hypothetical protein